LSSELHTSLLTYLPSAGKQSFVGSAASQKKVSEIKIRRYSSVPGMSNKMKLASKFL